MIGCFSRAIAYHLNFEKMVAHVKWQFAFPLNVVVDDDAPADDAGDDAGDDGSSAFDVERFADLYNNDGGAAAPLENGNFVVEFGKLVHSGSAAVKGIETRVFEVNVTSGEIVASLTMPRAYWVDGQYRSLPRDSVAGESASAPFPLVV